MIKVNEIRVGNYLKSHLTGDYIKADWLAIKHISDGNIQSVYNPKIPVYEPIPLTPELLEKCGFDKRIVTTQDVWNPDGIATIYWDKELDNMKILCLREDQPESFIWGNELGGYIKYLHQLENLYNILTGEELNINL